MKFKWFWGLPAYVVGFFSSVLGGRAESRPVSIQPDRPLALEQPAANGRPAVNRVPLPEDRDASFKISLGALQGRLFRKTDKPPAVRSAYPKLDPGESSEVVR